MQQTYCNSFELIEENPLKRRLVSGRFRQQQGKKSIRPSDFKAKQARLFLSSKFYAVIVSLRTFAKADSKEKVQLNKGGLKNLPPQFSKVDLSEKLCVRDKLFGVETLKFGLNVFCVEMEMHVYCACPNLGVRRSCEQVILDGLVGMLCPHFPLRDQYQHQIRSTRIQ